jgi:hypothetical protein
MADRIKALEREVERLRRRLEQRPVVTVTSAAVRYNTVTIDQGNTLETGQEGIVFEPDVASVPSAYDPNATGTFIDGIGRGTLYVNGVAKAGYVLVVNDNRGSFRNALVNSDVIFAGGPVSIPVDGGGSVQAYTAG